MKKNAPRKNSRLMPWLIVLCTIAVALLFVAAFIVCLFSGNKLTVVNYFAAFKNKDYIMWYLIMLLVVVLFIAVNYRINAKKEVMKENSGETSRLLTQSDMKKSKDFQIAKLSQLHKYNDGIPLFAEKTFNNDVDIVLSGKPSHVQILGNTGSGKTTGFIDPTIQALAHTKTKPSMILSDPKGELYNAHAARMQELGYKVQVIDLAEPYRSTKWNPLEILRERIDKITELSFSETGELDDNAKVSIQILRDEIYENAKDLTEALCPLSKSHDETWQTGARSLINAIVLAMCEDYEAEEMTADQFCITSLYHIVTDHANAEIDMLKTYLYDYRSPLSKVKGLAKQVMETQERTLTSYLSDVNKYAEWLTDTGVLSLTSSNEIDFYSFDEVPTVLFIKIPDEKKTRHRLVTLLVTQMYKSFVEKARRNMKSGATKELELQRNTYFILDEFANLPIFQDLSTMITVARSRKIFFMLVIQSYAQMINKYGREIAQSVKDNCNIKIYLGSDDPETVNEISTKIGKKKVSNLNITSTVEKGVSSSSTSSQEVPLIYPSELAKINNTDDFGNAIVMCFGHYALRVKYTPSWQCQSIYRLGQNKLPQPIAKVFDEQKHIFNIEDKMDKISLIEKDQEELKKLMVVQAAQAQSKKSTDGKEIIKDKILSLKSLIGDVELDSLITADKAEIELRLNQLVAIEKNMSVKFKLLEILQILQSKEKGGRQ